MKYLLVGHTSYVWSPKFNLCVPLTSLKKSWRLVFATSAEEGFSPALNQA